MPPFFKNMTTELKDNIKEIKITHSVVFPSFDDNVLKCFIKELETFAEKILLKEFTVKKQTAGNTFDYRFEAKDGRIWNQKLIFKELPDPDPEMTFDVEDPWKLTEFTLHRTLRDNVVILINQHGATEIKCKYLWN